MSLSPLVALCLAGVAVLMPPARSPQSDPPRGHLVLVVEGDAAGLRITKVVPKPDPLGRQRDETRHAVVVRDALGRALWTGPLDLSVFDLSPARRGLPARVEGDRVIPTQVVALVNVPHFAAMAALELLDGERRVGRLDGAALRDALEGR